MRDARPTTVVSRVLLGLTAVLAATYVVVVGSLPPERDATATPLLGVVFLLLAVLAWVRTARAGWRPTDVALAAGQSLAAVGWSYWAVFLVPLAAPPYPSPADALWLARFPLLFFALAWHLGRSPAPRRALAIDLLIGALGVAAAVAGLALPAVADGAQDPVAVTVNSVYLGAAVAYLVALVSVITMRGLRVPPGLWAQLVAAALIVVANGAFLVEVSETGRVPGDTVLTVTWVVSFALISSSAGTPVPAERLTVPRWSVVVVPLTGTVLSLAVLVLAPDNQSARWVASAAVALAAVRMALAFVAVEELAGSHHLAHTDELTGLVNRRGFYRALRHALDESHPATVVLLDLNRFKEVNDTLGHHVGDVLLTRIGQRLAGETRSGDRGPDVAARIGGDEFALLLRRGSPAAGEAAARRLLAALSGAYELGGVVVRASAAAGLVHLPEDADDPGEVMRKADIAMYAAKAGGTTLTAYHAGLDNRSAADLDRMEHVRTALADGGLVLHYQPKVDLHTGAVLGVEALARLRDGGDTLIQPGEFLPLLAHVGQLVSLTAQVMDQAIGQAAAWARSGTALPVAVNVPAAALVEDAFVERVRDTLLRHDVPGRLLFLEVTEESLLQDRAAARATLQAVRALGVRVSIDDYGTGWSSLTYLRELPLDELKLDRTFVRGLATDPRATRIVTSTVALAHGLDLTVVAEGVETEEDRAAAAAAGCDVAQGYWFTRPVPAEELAALVAAGPAPRTAPWHRSPEPLS